MELRGNKLAHRHFLFVIFSSHGQLLNIKILVFVVKCILALVSLGMHMGDGREGEGV